MPLLNNMKKCLKQARRNHHRLGKPEETIAPDSPVKPARTSRNHLIALLSRKTLLQAAGKPPRQRRPRTGEAAIKVLPAIPERTGRLSSERLRAQLPLLLPYAEGVIPGYTEAIGGELQQISARRMTRRLQPCNRRRRARTTSANRARQLRH